MFAFSFSSNSAGQQTFPWRLMPFIESRSFGIYWWMSSILKFIFHFLLGQIWTITNLMISFFLYSGLNQLQPSLTAGHFWLLVVFYLIKFPVSLHSSLIWLLLVIECAVIIHFILRCVIFSQQRDKILRLFEYCSRDEYHAEADGHTCWWRLRVWVIVNSEVSEWVVWWQWWCQCPAGRQLTWSDAFAQTLWWTQIVNCWQLAERSWEHAVQHVASFLQSQLASFLNLSVFCLQTERKRESCSSTT